MPKLLKGSDEAKERMSALRLMRKPKGVVETAPVPVVEEIKIETPAPVVVPDVPVVVADAVKPKRTKKVKQNASTENIIIV